MNRKTDCRSDLYSHQKAALAKMKNGCVLCGGVGSGKSRTSLAYYILNEAKRPLYIITTARKRDTKEWLSECKDIHLETQPVIDSWNNIKKYADVFGSFFIFDEQRIVGSGSWVKSFLKIARKNHWILLSATPGDTWMDYVALFVANGFYKNRTDFCRQHVVWSRFSKYPKVERWQGTAALEKHRKDILVDMPFKKVAVQHWIDYYADYDVALMNAIQRKRWNPWAEEPIRDIASVCYLMRRAANQDPSRMSKLLDIQKDHPKIVVFYNFDYELDILRQGLKEAGIPWAEWNGHRHDIIPKLDEWCYLVQYTAGAEGWNCVHTDTMIFYSTNYSYRTMTQASGRIDRLNTPFPVLNYYRFTSKSRIDQAILQALENKRDFNEREFERQIFS